MDFILLLYNSPYTALAAASPKDARAASLLLLPSTSAEAADSTSFLPKSSLGTAHAATSPGHSLLQALAPCSSADSLSQHAPLAALPSSPRAFWTCSYVQRVALPGPMAGCYTSV